MKQCSRCGNDKPDTAFNKSSASKDGLQSYCTDCRYLYNKKYEVTKNEKYFRPIECVWKESRMHATVHRIIWWMIDIGAVGSSLKTGWKQYAMRDLELSKDVLEKKVSTMVKTKILDLDEDTGEITINAGIFKKRGNMSSLLLSKK